MLNEIERKKKPVEKWQLEQHELLSVALGITFGLAQAFRADCERTQS